MAGRFIPTCGVSAGATTAIGTQPKRFDALSVTGLLIRWSYGITGSGGGYDYRLPDIYPPNPMMGTLADFVELVQACKTNGVLFAPHDNYIDFYPDAEDFSYNTITFNPIGQPVRAYVSPLEMDRHLTACERTGRIVSLRAI